MSTGYIGFPSKRTYSAITQTYRSISSPRLSMGTALR